MNGIAEPPELSQSRFVERPEKRGADVVELGMPFSDPSADGPVIQRASQRALGAGTRFDDVLALVRDLRAGRIDGAPAGLPGRRSRAHSSGQPCAPMSFTKRQAMP